MFEDLFGSFIRRERAPGFLSSLDSEERQQALDLLPVEATALASAVAYSVLRPHGPWHAHVFTWQPFIVMGIEDGVFAAGTGAAEVVERLTGELPTADEIDERLLWAAGYINDERWAARIRKELGFEHVLIAHRGFNAAYPVHLTVVGSNDPLRDPQMLSAARQALRYRRSDGITVEAGETRMSLKLGGPAAARVEGRALKSAGPVDMDDLRGVETAGGGWAQLLAGEERATA